jgi:hypothetical protein
MQGARYVRLIPWTLHSGSEQLMPLKRNNNAAGYYEK